MYLNSVTIVGFVGADPEQRQSRSNGAKFTVLSVATQRSWKNAQDEWSSKTEWHRVCIFRPRLAEYVAQTIKKGSHVLIEGSLISSTYERPNGKGKKATTAKITSWSIRADAVRRLDRGEPEPESCRSELTLLNVFCFKRFPKFDLGENGHIWAQLLRRMLRRI